MPTSVIAYIVLLVLVGALRLGEMQLSKRNQRRMAKAGVAKVPEPALPWMILLHARNPDIGGSGSGAATPALDTRHSQSARESCSLRQLIRWWVIHTMAGHWNVQVMASTTLGVITTGPYKWVRHPNYLAVVLESSLSL